MCQHCHPVNAKEGFWRPGDDIAHVQGTGAAIWRPDVYEVIEETIARLDADLRKLSLDIHGMFATYGTRSRLVLTWDEKDHPEIRFQEQ